MYSHVYSTENPHTEHAKGLRQNQTQNMIPKTSENVDLAELCKLMKSSCVYKEVQRTDPAAERRHY